MVLLGNSVNICLYYGSLSLGTENMSSHRAIVDCGAFMGVWDRSEAMGESLREWIWNSHRKITGDVCQTITLLISPNLE